jgi:hypothetical protein
VTDRIQDGRRRHVGNSSECHKMGSYNPILMKVGTKAKNNMLSSKITTTEVTDCFQDCRRRRRRHVGNSSACYKVGI